MSRHFVDHEGTPAATGRRRLTASWGVWEERAGVAEQSALQPPSHPWAKAENLTMPRAGKVSKSQTFTCLTAQETEPGFPTASR